MSFRTEAIYIQRRTKKRLWMVLSLYPRDRFEYIGRSTDDLADWLINQAVEEHYPVVLQCEKEKEKLEEKFALSIKGVK